MKSLARFFSRIRDGVSAGFRRTTGAFNTSVRKRPILTFAALIGVLFLLILASSQITKPAPAPEPPKREARQVEVFSIGTAPTIKAQARIEKSGVIRIVAQTGGIVQNINVREGQSVAKGTTLTNISTNYQGGTALTVQRQIAEKQWFNTRETFDAQKDLIGKQKQVAEKSEENSEELRKITEKSLGETRGLIELNELILATTNQSLGNLEATNSAEMNREAITGLRGQKAQLVSGLNQLRSALRNAEYSAGGENAPAELADLNKEIAIKQLELQEKSLELGKEVAHLQYSLALVNEAIAYPAAPCAGVIEKVHVRFGESVTPGTVLFTLSTNEKSALAVALVSGEIARSVSVMEPSIVQVNGTQFSLMPSYVSQEATDGTLYSIYYALPEEFMAKFTDNGYVDVTVPVGYADSTAAVPFVPIDAVHQTQDQAYVFVVENGKAKSREVQLGAVFGQLVEVREGIKAADRVIINRTVVDDEAVKVRSL